MAATASSATVTAGPCLEGEGPRQNDTPTGPNPAGGGHLPLSPTGRQPDERNRAAAVGPPRLLPPPGDHGLFLPLAGRPGRSSLFRDPAVAPGRPAQEEPVPHA